MWSGRSLFNKFGFILRLLWGPVMLTRLKIGCVHIVLQVCFVNVKTGDFLLENNWGAHFTVVLFCCFLFTFCGTSLLCDLWTNTLQEPLDSGEKNPANFNVWFWEMPRRHISIDVLDRYVDISTWVWFPYFLVQKGMTGHLWSNAHYVVHQPQCWIQLV